MHVEDSQKVKEIKSEDNEVQSQSSINCAHEEKSRLHKILNHVTKFHVKIGSKHEGHPRSTHSQDTMPWLKHPQTRNESLRKVKKKDVSSLDSVALPGRSLNLDLEEMENNQQEQEEFRRKSISTIRKRRPSIHGDLGKLTKSSKLEKSSSSGVISLSFHSSIPNCEISTSKSTSQQLSNEDSKAHLANDMKQVSRKSSVQSTFQEKIGKMESYTDSESEYGLSSARSSFSNRGRTIGFHLKLSKRSNGRTINAKKSTIPLSNTDNCKVHLPESRHKMTSSKKSNSSPKRNVLQNLLQRVETSNLVAASDTNIKEPIRLGKRKELSSPRARKVLRIKSFSISSDIPRKKLLAANTSTKLSSIHDTVSKSPIIESSKSIKVSMPIPSDDNSSEDIDNVIKTTVEDKLYESLNSSQERKNKLGSLKENYERSNSPSKTNFEDPVMSRDISLRTQIEKPSLIEIPIAKQTITALSQKHLAMQTLDAVVKKIPQEIEKKSKMLRNEQKVLDKQRLRQILGMDEKKLVPVLREVSNDPTFHPLTRSSKFYRKPTGYSRIVPRTSFIEPYSVSYHGGDANMDTKNVDGDYSRRLIEPVTTATLIHSVSQELDQAVHNLTKQSSAPNLQVSQAQYKTLRANTSSAPEMSPKDSKIHKSPRLKKIYKAVIMPKSTGNLSPRPPDDSRSNSPQLNLAEANESPFAVEFDHSRVASTSDRNASSNEDVDIDNIVATEDNPIVDIAGQKSNISEHRRRFSAESDDRTPLASIKTLYQYMMEDMRFGSKDSLTYPNSESNEISLDQLLDEYIMKTQHRTSEESHSEVSVRFMHSKTPTPPQNDDDDMDAEISNLLKKIQSEKYNASRPTTGHFLSPTVASNKIDRRPRNKLLSRKQKFKHKSMTISTRVGSLRRINQEEQRLLYDFTKSSFEEYSEVPPPIYTEASPPTPEYLRKEEYFDEVYIVERKEKEKEENTFNLPSPFKKMKEQKRFAF